MQPAKPRAVRPGDVVGLVSTSSPVPAEQLDRITGYLRARGYAVRVPDGVLDRTGHFGGTAGQRAAGVMRMFADPEVALVMPVTGGFGAVHLVDLLDYQAIRAHPKVFAGFSDSSVLNSSILAAAALPSVHGVCGIHFSGWPDPDEPDEPTETAFWRMVSGPVAGWELPGPDWRVYRARTTAVSGPVVAGFWQSFAALAGTRWMPSLAGAILLTEALPGTTYGDVDRFLTHLRLAGAFDDNAALVVGAPADWEPGDSPDTSTDELILRCVNGSFPVITGVPFGHQRTKIQLPVGCRIEFGLGAPQPVLRYLEDLVAC
jgi:muramoyltetrapeptide carboxypeptidase